MWLFVATLIGFFLSCVLPFLITGMFENPPHYIAIIVVVVLLFYPFRIPWLRRRALWKSLITRMQYTVIDSAGEPPMLDLDEQLVFGVAPHGTFCFSIMLTWVFDNPTSPLVPRHRIVVPLVASQLLRVPLLGALCRMLGCQPITRDNYQTQLANNHSVALSPGGAKEAMFADHLIGRSITVLRRHNHSWIDFAMFNNTNVVPVLSLGECSGYRMFRSFRPLQQFCYKLVGYPFPNLNFGAAGSFWPKKSAAVTLVVGNKLKWDDYESAAGMADAYYNELKRLAEARGYMMEFVHS